MVGGGIGGSGALTLGELVGSVGVEGVALGGEGLVGAGLVGEGLVGSIGVEGVVLGGEGLVGVALGCKGLDGGFGADGIPARGEPMRDIVALLMPNPPDPCMPPIAPMPPIPPAIPPIPAATAVPVLTAMTSADAHSVKTVLSFHMRDMRKLLSYFCRERLEFAYPARTTTYSNGLARALFLARENSFGDSRLKLRFVQSFSRIAICIC